MSSRCLECGAVNEELHKKDCYWYSREAKARDKKITELQARINKVLNMNLTSESGLCCHGLLHDIEQYLKGS